MRTAEEQLSDMEKRVKKLEERNEDLVLMVKRAAREMPRVAAKDFLTDLEALLKS